LARRAFLMLLKQSTFQVEGITIIGVDWETHILPERQMKPQTNEEGR
jgi:hypothetical protein